MTPRTPAPPVAWGIGQVAGSRPWAVAQADIDDEATVAEDHLRSLGVCESSVVLLVSRLSDAIHVSPFEIAAGRLGARYSSADATEGDAFRTEVLVRRLHPAAVVGVNADVIAGLAGRGADLAAVFAGVPAVAVADAVAHAALTVAGCAPRWWLRLGPTSAVECAERDGAHVDGDRWSVDSEGGEIVLSNVAPRLTPAARLTTGVHGTVVEEPCGCGRPGPRVRV